MTAVRRMSGCCVFRNCGRHGCGFSPAIPGDHAWSRVHGHDEGVSGHSEMRRDAAAA